MHWGFIVLKGERPPLSQAVVPTRATAGISGKHHFLDGVKSIAANDFYRVSCRKIDNHDAFADERPSRLLIGR